MNTPKAVFLLLFAIQLLHGVRPVIFTLTEKDEVRCFIIRSENAKSTISFSYVVHSNFIQGNKISFELRTKPEGELINEVKPDNKSFQRLFKFESDGSTVYRACFKNPDEQKKKVKFFVENKNKELYIEKQKLRASMRMIGEMKAEAAKVEDKMFLMYMSIKHNEEDFRQSQSMLKFIFFIKLFILVFIAFAQSYYVVKLLAATKTKLSDLI